MTLTSATPRSNYKKLLMIVVVLNYFTMIHSINKSSPLTKHLHNYYYVDPTASREASKCCYKEIEVQGG